MKPSRKILFFICVILSCLSLPFFITQSHSESLCDKSLTPESGDYGYLPRSENRCEGFYGNEINISGRIDIIGAIQGTLSFDLNNPAPVVILVPDLPGSFTNPVRIRAVGIQPETYYQMDGIPEQGKLIWPVNEILQAVGLSCEQISILAWTSYKSQTILVPVAAQQDPKTESDKRSVLIVRTNVKLEKLLYRMAPAGKMPTEGFEYKNATKDIVFPGTAVKLAVPEGPAGILQVEIQAKPAASNKWLKPLFLSVYRVEEK